MASTPDPHPDSIPGGPSDDPERVSDPTEPRRESVEDVPGGDNSVATIDVADLRRADGDTVSGAARTLEDSAGDFAGTAGTGGENKAQDRDL